MSVGPIDVDEYRERCERAAVAVERAGYDALVCYASHVHQGSVRYLTGYEPWLAPEEWAFAVLVPARGSEPSLLSNSPWDFWDFNRSASTWVRDVTVGSAWVDEIRRRLPTAPRRIGIAGWFAFPTGVFDGLRRHLPETDFVDATPLLRGLRARKSDSEIAILAELGRISDVGGRALFAATEPGVTEREVVAQVDAALTRAGTERFAYHTNVGSGTRTIAASFLPGDRIIAQGDIVQLDAGPMLHGYRADFSRVMLAGGRGTAQTLRLVETAVEMYESCVQALRPGNRCSDVARVGLAALERRGYTRENLFKSANYPDMVFMGHGIGLENPDPPGMLTLTNDTVLDEGMVINLEPILLQPNVGGARIESAFVITSTGSRSLNDCETRTWVRGT